MSDSEIRIPFAGGRQMRASLLSPSRPNGLDAGVIVIHDVFGFTPDVHRIGERLRDAGYTVLIPDLYDDARSKPLCVVKTLTAHQRGKGQPFAMLEAARHYLLDQVGVRKVGVMGFCMGGHFAVLYAAQAPVDVVAPFYGAVPSKAQDIAGICPVVGGWGKTDRIFAPHGKRLIRHLDQLGVEHDVKLYDNVGHSYMNNHQTFVFKQLGNLNPMHARYDEAAAEDSWARVFDFFARVLARD